MYEIAVCAQVRFTTFRGKWQAVGTESPFWRIARRALLETDALPVEEK